MRILISIFLILFSAPCFGATLTIGYVPVVAQGGSAPQVQNGSIYDTGTTNGPGEVGISNITPVETLDVGGVVKVRGLQEVGLPNQGGVTYACFNSSGILVSQSSAC